MQKAYGLIRKQHYTRLLRMREIIVCVTNWLVVVQLGQLATLKLLNLVTEEKDSRKCRDGLKEQDGQRRVKNEHWKEQDGNWKVRDKRDVRLEEV